MVKTEENGIRELQDVHGELQNLLQTSEMENKRRQKELKRLQEKVIEADSLLTARGMDSVERLTALEASIQEISAHTEAAAALSEEELTATANDLETWCSEEAERLADEIRECEDNLRQLEARRDETRRLQEASHSKFQARKLELMREIDDLADTRNPAMIRTFQEIQSVATHRNNVYKLNIELRQELANAKCGRNWNNDADVLLAQYKKETEQLAAERLEIQSESTIARLDLRNEDTKLMLSQARNEMLRFQLQLAGNGVTDESTKALPDTVAA
eukprot:GEMP01034869.1.p1 GENE.GEMP01034869.1~~GEMP01034869.1.p1  ORF type:complete len:275 (+),score=76.26 GEMP01034869.1:361-1185(+)